MSEIPTYTPCPMAARGLGRHFGAREDAERGYGWIIRDSEPPAIQRAREYAALVPDCGPILVARSRRESWLTFAFADLDQNPTAAHDRNWCPVALIVRPD